MALTSDHGRDGRAVAELSTIRKEATNRKSHAKIEVCGGTQPGNPYFTMTARAFNGRDIKIEKVYRSVDEVPEMPERVRVQVEACLDEFRHEGPAIQNIPVALAVED